MKTKITWQGIKEWIEFVCLLGAFAGPFLAFPVAYIFRMFTTPDMNGDGVFTISDFGSGLWITWSYVGEGLMDLLGWEPPWRFLEISQEDSRDSTIFALLCLTGWWLWGVALVVVGVISTSLSEDDV